MPLLHKMRNHTPVVTSFLWGLLSPPVVLLFFSCCTVWSPTAVLLVDACDCRHADFVPHLPGWDQPTPSPWYSGYLSYTLPHPTEDGGDDVQVHTHYVLVQAEQDFHRTKPLLYWSNGGPGASSLFGLLTELGPLQLSDDSLRTNSYRSDGIPSFTYSKYGWARLGSVLILDQPAPVGFSYCNNDTTADPANNNGSCGSWTDERAAESVYWALQAFYDKFPCYNATDLYLTGESYAGIYIPTLARRILQEGEKNNRPSKMTSTSSSSTTSTLRSSTLIRNLLKGFAVGDGCLGTETAVCGDLSPLHRPDLYRLLFLAGHGQIPFRTFSEAVFACQPPPVGASLEGRRSSFSSSGWALDNEECQRALDKAKDQAGGYFEYSLYDDCIYRNLASSSGTDRTDIRGALNDYPCGGFPVMQEWLSHPDVKRALHLHGNFFSVDNAEDFDYTPTERDLSGFYQHVASETNLRVLVYNGDADPAITSFATQNWTEALELHVSQAWRPWSIDHCQRVGGYVTRYEGDLDFLTVRGAGHMVPTYKAEATFAFLKAWIEGQDYPRYDPSCTKPPQPKEDGSNFEVAVNGAITEAL